MGFGILSALAKKTPRITKISVLKQRENMDDLTLPRRHNGCQPCDTDALGFLRFLRIESPRISSGERCEPAGRAWRRQASDHDNSRRRSASTTIETATFPITVGKRAYRKLDPQRTARLLLSDNPTFMDVPEACNTHRIEMKGDSIAQNRGKEPVCKRKVHNDASSLRKMTHLAVKPLRRCVHMIFRGCRHRIVAG